MGTTDCADDATERSALTCSEDSRAFRRTLVTPSSVGAHHLASALAAHDSPWIENRRNREALEQALAAIRGLIGTVIVVGPAGAVVSVDGTVVGRLPLAAPVRVPEGSVRVRGTALGHKPAEVDAAVAGGAETTVTLDLGVPIPPPFPAAPIIDDEPPPASPARWKAWTGGSLLVASAAALIAGGVGLGIDNNGTCSAPAGARCEHLYDTKAQGWIALGVGVAAGVGGGVLLWQGTRSETRLSLSPGLLQLAGRFLAPVAEVASASPGTLCRRI